MTKQHFGNPMIEQRQLQAGEAIALLAEVGIIRVKGVDRLNWLHSLLSQDFMSLSPGKSSEALLLDPQGRIEQLIKVIEDGESCWLIVEREKLPALRSWLEKMIFRKQVQLIDETENFAMIGSTSPLAELAATSNSIPLIWQENWPTIATGGYRYSQREISYSWFEQLVEKSQLEKKLSGHKLAGLLAAEALRVAAGKPALAEIDEKTLPHELDLLTTAVHLTKGCYRGQESVAKVHNLGHPPRRLTFLHLDGSDALLPEPGSEVFLAGEQGIRGKITSVAQHYEMGPIALAVLQRSVPEDGELLVKTASGDVAAKQEIIVPASAGKTAAVPKLPRLKLGVRLSS